MPDPVAPLPDSPAAPVAASPSPPSLEGLTRAQRDDWKLTGTFPDVPAASSPAAPAEQAGSTDPLPPVASEPTRLRANAETRIPELIAERAAAKAEADALRRELAALSRPAAADVPPAASSPATASTFPDYETYCRTHPDTPYETYLDARADARADARMQLREQDARAKQQQVQTAQAVHQRDAAFRTRIDTFTQTADPAWFERISPEVRGLRPFNALQVGEQATAQNAVAEALLVSPVAPQLMQHWTDHPAELQRLYPLLPFELAREIGKLEAKLEAGLTMPPVVPPKHQTSAPAPPTTLGGKPADAVDPAVGAVKRGDFAAYRAQMNQRELADSK